MLTWFDPFLPLLALSRSPGSQGRDVFQDLEIIREASVEHIVCLQQAFELDYVDETIESRREAVESRGMTFTHEPIEDFDAPTLAQAFQIVELVRAEMSAGRRVLVHCQAGLGRAGTIAACLLLGEGMSVQDAITTVRSYRFGAIQSPEQERLIAMYAESMA